MHAQPPAAKARHYLDSERGVPNKGDAPNYLFSLFSRASGLYMLLFLSTRFLQVAGDPFSASLSMSPSFALTRDPCGTTGLRCAARRRRQGQPVAPGLCGRRAGPPAQPRPPRPRAAHRSRRGP